MSKSKTTLAFSSPTGRISQDDFEDLTMDEWRDEIAIDAMKATLSGGQGNFLAGSPPQLEARRLAAWSYLVADAMIEEANREVGPTHAAASVLTPPTAGD